MPYLPDNGLSGRRKIHRGIVVMAARGFALRSIEEPK